MVRITAGSNVFVPACRSRAILPTLVGLCLGIGIGAQPSVCFVRLQA